MQKKRKVKIFVILTILLASLFFLNSEKDETITYGLVSITEQKTTPEVLEQLETSTEETMELLIKTTNNNKVKNTIISKGGKIKRITKNYISIEIPANIINEIIEVPELEKIYPNRKYSMLDSISQINANFVNNLGFQGNGIKIAVLDTGIDSHDALKDKIANEKAFTGESHINDINGHGTHVAGIITSIAPEASLLNAKVLDDSGNGYTDTIIAGIEWAIENNA
ncbi:MAG: S8 family serine peptidase, partial [Nanoarchaeota archaeon]|nr:S8 family serine peptidase [Nanoarchaeota archaeon]